MAHIPLPVSDSRDVRSYMKIGLLQGFSGRCRFVPVRHGRCTCEHRWRAIAPGHSQTKWERRSDATPTEVSHHHEESDFSCNSMFGSGGLCCGSSWLFANNRRPRRTPELRARLRSLSCTAQRRMGQRREQVRRYNLGRIDSVGPGRRQFVREDHCLRRKYPRTTPQQHGRRNT